MTRIIKIDLYYRCIFASSIIFIFATSKVISLVLKMSRSKNPKKVWTIEKVLSQMLSRKEEFSIKDEVTGLEIIVD